MAAGKNERHASKDDNAAKPKSQDETTPLLPDKQTRPATGEGGQEHEEEREVGERRWPKSVIYRVLCTAFMVSLSFGVTQVPLIYVIGKLLCDDYYEHHPSPHPGTPAYQERCRVHSIEASTARAVALLGCGTTLFGVINLFFTGWSIKVWGVKRALLITIFWPAMRLMVQNIGVQTGAKLGIWIIQLSQVITIFGGPAGYLLALNSFATEVVLPAERTAIIGRLSGCAMFGTALGFLAGGLLSDGFGMIVPFRVALVLFCLSTLYTAIALPTIPTSKEVQEKAAKNLSTFFDPLKMFTPRKWMLPNGVIRTEYGVFLLGTGAFMAIFATGYIPVLLQMYATDVFGFSTTDNSELISLNFVVRACYLTFAFPAIINIGRSWLDNRNRKKKARVGLIKDVPEDAIDDDEDFQTNADQLVGSALPAGEANANEPDEHIRRLSRLSTISRAKDPKAKDTRPESFAFDLLYTRYSLILDGILTCLATFTVKGWQMYAVAVILPLAAGTGSAAKGTMLQMCAPEQKTDALSAISLLEMMARLSTTSLFGLIFGAFAEIGQPNLTFAVNGAVAVVGFFVLLFARFPPEGAVRYDGDEDTEDDAG